MHNNRITAYDHCYAAAKPIGHQINHSHISTVAYIIQCMIITKASMNYNCVLHKNELAK